MLHNNLPARPTFDPDKAGKMSSLKELREQSGRKQLDVAAEAGISREYLSILENDRARPSSKLAERLASIYGVSPLVILGYPVAEADRTLRDERDLIWHRFERSNEEHAREIQAIQARLEAVESENETLRRQLDFSQSVCKMLMKQINSREESETEGENR